MSTFFCSTDNEIKANSEFFTDNKTRSCQKKTNLALTSRFQLLKNVRDFVSCNQSHFVKPQMRLRKK
jgi:hypothetical protein